jgi:hypothetical protein
MCLKEIVGKSIYLSVVLILAIGAPFHFEFNTSNFIVPSIAIAKGGGDSGGGGNSGSGSDNSGSGSENSGSGKTGSGGSNNNSASVSNLRTRSQNGISNIERGGGSDIEVHYNNGWTEQIKSGLYELRDNINRKVISRKARQDDYDRFRAISPDR